MNDDPLALYRPLAEAYHLETGEYPPGKQNPGAAEDEAAWERWRLWREARAAGAAPKPRRQAGLFDQG